jgi:hypothetical protein
MIWLQSILDESLHEPKVEQEHSRLEEDLNFHQLSLIK